MADIWSGFGPWDTLKNSALFPGFATLFNNSIHIPGRTPSEGKLLEWAHLDLFRGGQLGPIFNKYSMSN